MLILLALWQIHPDTYAGPVEWGSMALRTWLLPPRHLVVLFLGITLVLMGTLGWLGVRLFRQDRALERQRVQDRLERAADAVVVALQRELSSFEDRLSRLSNNDASDVPAAAEGCAESLSEDAVLVVLDSVRAEAYPQGRLIYQPVVAAEREPDASVYARGEAYEFRDRNFTAAARFYRRLAESSDSGVRAGALLRLARTQRRAGDSEAALLSYAELTELGATPVGAGPADLVALSASLDLLEALGRVDELRSMAESLYSDLHSGRWRMTRAQYEFHLGSVCQKISCDATERAAAPRSLKPAHALAAGVELLWDRRATLGGSGREVAWIGGSPLLLLWQRFGDRTVGLVGGLRHIEDDWVGPLQPLLESERVSVGLSDIVGHSLIAAPLEETVASAARTAADTRLPWTVHVTSSDPVADFAQLAERRRILLFARVGGGAAAVGFRGRSLARVSHPTHIPQATRGVAVEWKGVVGRASGVLLQGHGAGGRQTASPRGGPVGFRAYGGGRPGVPR
jgi:tetratricopeptide (TPR) repeat protein